MYPDDLINKRTEELISDLNQATIIGVDKFIRKLKQVLDKQDYLDILVEGRFALMLIQGGFSNVQIEPFDKGPDIKASCDGCILYFEVTRRRPTEADYIIEKTKGPWWVSPEKDDTVIGKIRDELSQLINGEKNIIVVWSNTIKLGKPEVQQAFKSINEEIENNKEAFHKLSGVLLVQDEKIDLTMPEEIYFSPNNYASNQLPCWLINKLECILEIS